MSELLLAVTMKPFIGVTQLGIQVNHEVVTFIAAILANLEALKK